MTWEVTYQLSFRFSLETTLLDYGLHTKKKYDRNILESRFYFYFSDIRKRIKKNQNTKSIRNFTKLVQIFG